MLNIRDLFQAITELPIYTQSQASDRRMMDYTINIYLAQVGATAATLALDDPLDRIAKLQEYIVMYLHFRNSMEHSINRNVPGNSASSGNSTNGIRDMKAAFAAAPSAARTSNFGAAMREAFDYNALDARLGTETDAAYANRIARPLAQHILTVFRMFPAITAGEKTSFQQNFILKTNTQLGLSATVLAALAPDIRAMTGIP